MYVIRMVFFVAMILSTAVAFAVEQFPSDCRPIVVTEEPLILSTEKPMLVMMHNLSNSDLWITHPVVEPSVNAGWSTRLEADHWSALVLREKKFELSCIESKPGHEQQVPCSDVLAICQWESLQIPQHLVGTFWAGENKTLSTLSAYLGRRGFVKNTPGYDKKQDTNSPRQND